MRVKTAVGDKRPMALRARTGVAWMGLLRKLCEKSEVRVLEYPPYGPIVQLVRTPGS